VAGSTGAAAGAALIEAGCHLFAPMRELRRPHHLPGRIVDHREARGLAAGVDLEPQWLRLLGWFTFLEHEGERETAVDRCPSTRQEMSRTAWVDRSARLPLVVYDQDH
jgi:hypothetical protein